MKLSEIIERFVDLKIEGEPTTGEWQSLANHYNNVGNYWAELEELRTEIDSYMKEV